MSSLVIKIGSLFIKSLSKPIANRIKLQAREHERFRRVCVKLAQGIHQWDMRFRLGLLQDTAAIERQMAREAAEAQAKKHKHEIPTVKTEAQTKADEAAAASKAKDVQKEKVKEETRKRPRIRPLSEAKAIDAGANFVSETFLLVVAVACIFGERYYSSKKESSRREDVSERIGDLEQSERAARRALVGLEKEVLRLRASEGSPPPKSGRIIPREVFDLEQQEENEGKQATTWRSWLPNFGKKPETPASPSRQKPLETEEREDKPDSAPTIFERITKLAGREHGPSTTGDPEQRSPIDHE